MPRTMTRGEFVDINRAAELLGVNVRFMRRLVAERRIAHHKVGRCLRFSTADIEAFVEAGRREAVTR